MRLALILLISAMTAPALAQQTTPDAQRPPQESALPSGDTSPTSASSGILNKELMDSLRICRAAAIMELSRGGKRGSIAHAAIANVIIDQIAYAAAADILRPVTPTVEKARERLEHIEALILGFAAVVQENRVQLEEQDRRHDVLINCVGPSWQVTRQRLEQLALALQRERER